jgi:hypothetical protein
MKRIQAILDELVPSMAVYVLVRRDLPEKQRMVQATHAALEMEKDERDPAFRTWRDRDHTLVILETDSLEADIEAVKAAWFRIRPFVDDDIDTEHPTAAVIGPDVKRQIRALLNDKVLA